MTKDTGGQAFPNEQDYLKDGMTLRDYFASQALMGMCSALTSEEKDHINGISIVSHSYKFADAMIAERNKE